MTTTATQARDEAIEQVKRSTPAEWAKDARTCLVAILMTQRTATTDDVWQVIGQPPEPRALGGVIKDMVDNRTIEPTGEYVASIRPKCHARPVRVWRLHRRIDSDLRRRVVATRGEPGDQLDTLRAKYAA